MRFFCHWIAFKECKRGEKRTPNPRRGVVKRLLLTHGTLRGATARCEAFSRSLGLPLPSPRQQRAGGVQGAPVLRRREPFPRDRLVLELLEKQTATETAIGVLFFP